MDFNTGSLEEWYEDYLVESHLETAFSEVRDDELNVDAFEENVRELMPNMRVAHGFCSKCQDLFDNWPNVLEKSTPNPSDTESLGSNLSIESGSEIQSDSGSDSGSGSSFVPSDIDSAIIRPYHENIYSLEASSRSGCRLCALLVQSLLDIDQLNLYRKISQRLDRLYKPAALHLAIQKWGHTHPTQFLWPNLPGKVSTDLYDARWKICSSFIKTVEPGQVKELTAPPPDALSIAKSWLTECTQNHTHCNFKDTTPLPTRLLSLTTDPPRLVLTAEWTSRPRYATLSHCWGNKEFFKLGPNNLKSLMSRIHIDDLPKTFRDAFEISRKLGLDYLWIDSLCIIQGDTQDWAHESTLMSSVYGGSCINIAASSAIDGTQGCFLKPEDFLGGFRAELSIDGCKKVFDFRVAGFYTKAVEDSTLAKRAWVLQEKLLSPRTLHCGNLGLFWECRELYASEFLPRGWESDDLPLVCRKEMPLKKSWWKIVRQYSSGRLTFSKDKLVALSGIARAVQNENKDQYLAGLWRRNMESQLCWKVLPRAIKIKPELYQAPGWSWASIDGAVSNTLVFPHPRRDFELAHVLDVNVILAGKDPFGQVSGGTLTLAYSVMATGTFLPNETYNPSQIEVDAGNKNQKFLCTVYRDFIVTDSNVSSTTVHLLPFYAGDNGSTSKIGTECVRNMSVVGIVLQPTGRIQGQYHRVGSFEFIYDVTDDDYHPFMKILEESGAAIAEAACAKTTTNAEHPKERFVITVV